jgi:hypothetical protein
MKNLRTTVLLFAVATLFNSGCSKSVSPDNAGIRIEQMPGCKSGQLGKGSHATDSCFTYQFTNALDVYFCASANCCPDSNRFSIRNEIRSDTIFVTIADTAAHLCRCNCTYMLHAEFHDLPKDRYVFLCSREDYSSLALLYSVTVQRH